jgi:hypothetical protein
LELWYQIFIDTSLNTAKINPELTQEQKACLISPGACSVK